MERSAPSLGIINSGSIDFDRLSIGILIGRGHSGIAAEIRPARMKDTVGTESGRRVIPDEHTLQHVSGHGADSHELNLWIGGLRRDSMDPAGTEPAKSSASADT